MVVLPKFLTASRQRFSLILDFSIPKANTYGYLILAFCQFHQTYTLQHYNFYMFHHNLTQEISLQVNPIDLCVILERQQLVWMTF